jgi:hypothetical protein
LLTRKNYHNNPTIALNRILRRFTGLKFYSHRTLNFPRSQKIARPAQSAQARRRQWLVFKKAAGRLATGPVVVVYYFYKTILYYFNTLGAYIYLLTNVLNRRKATFYQFHATFYQFHATFYQSKSNLLSV